MNSYKNNTDKEKRNAQLSSVSQRQAMGASSGVFLEDNRSSTVVQKKKNNTGMPDQLKSGIENLSGIDMSDTKVHYNSDKPAQLNAHAYAQGTDIHLASGQEKHLPHEAWHVVQQKQGRVKPTMQMKGKVNINDDDGLEKEADVMGEKALSFIMPSTIQNLNSSAIQKKAIYQRKNRIDTSKLAEEKKFAVEAKIAELKKNKTIEKKKVTAAWVKDNRTEAVMVEIEGIKGRRERLGEERKTINRRIANRTATIEEKQKIKANNDGHAQALAKLIATKQQELDMAEDRKAELDEDIAPLDQQIEKLEGILKRLEHERDTEYNNQILEIRRNFEIAIKELINTFNLSEDALISGDAYYGEEVKEGDDAEEITFYRRQDSGKEYVTDKRGTFIPRYVRRELNYKDVTGEKEVKDELTTTGISTVGGVDSNASEETKNNPLTFDQREFVQQSRGGGENQFAQSHTSTKRPILSNAHDSFGGPPKSGFPHVGAIITDLAQVDRDKLAAQWSIGDDGEKIPIRPGVHEVIGADAERDEVVRMSGYRNMEVLTTNISKKAITQPDITWQTLEGPKSDYEEGESKRGQSLAAFKERMAQAALEKMRADELVLVSQGGAADTKVEDTDKELQDNEI